MTRYDLTPLYRVGIGFDRMARLLDSALQLEEGQASYPPYNIEKQGEDSYRITLAVAGFAAEDIEITAHDRTLSVRGQKARAEDEGAASYLYQGIAARAFERRFQLAEHVKVDGAELKDGLLTIRLQREVPEALKPRSIKIEAVNSGSPTLKSQAA